LSYDEHHKKFLVKQVDSGVQKAVDRLSLLFDEEDRNQFKDRVQQAKYYQKRAEDEMRFQNYAEQVENSSVSTLSKIWIRDILQKSLTKKRKTKDDDVAYGETLAHRIIQTVEAEYLREMKKCFVLSEMKDKNSKEKFNKLKIAIRKELRKIPYFGTIGRLPSLPFYHMRSHQLAKKLLISERDNRVCFNDFAEKSSEKILTHLFNYNIPKVHLPMSNVSYSTLQTNAINDSTKALNNLWRESQITTISSVPAFNVSFNLEDYRENKKKMEPTIRFIQRMDFFFRSNVKSLSEFNLEKYVDFVRQFNMPIDDEVWSVSHTPLMLLAIKNYDMKEKEIKERERLEKERQEKERLEKERLEKEGKIKEIVEIKNEGKDKEEKEEVDIFEAELEDLIADMEGLYPEDKKEDAKKADKKKKKKDETNQPRSALKDEECVYFEPSKPEVLKTMLKPIVQLMRSINNIYTLRSTVLKNLDKGRITEQPPIYKVTKETPAFKQAIEQVKDLVNRAFVEPTRIIQLFRKHSDLFRSSSEDVVNKYLKAGDEKGDKRKTQQKKSVEELDEFIQVIDNSISDIQGICINEKNTIFFLLHTADNKKTMIEKAKEIKAALMNQIQIQNNERVINIKKKFDELEDRIGKVPQDEKDYDELMKVLEDPEKGHEKILERLEAQTDEVGKYFDLMIKYNRQLNFYINDYNWYWTLKRFPSYIKAKAREAKFAANKYFDNFQKQVVDERVQLSRTIAELEKEFEYWRHINFEDWSKKQIQNDEFQNNLDNAVKKMQELNSREKLLQIEASVYENLTLLIEKNEPYKKMRFWSVDFEGEESKWDKLALVKLRYQEVQRKVESVYKEVYSLQRKFELLEDSEEAHKICGHILAHINKFKEKMPLIKSLTKDALTGKNRGGINPYWTEIMRTTGLEAGAKKISQQTVTLSDLINEHKIIDHIQIVEEICNRAEREYALEIKYTDEILEILKKVRLTYADHKNTGTCIITGVDELMQLLDEKLTLLVVMKQNPNIKPIKGDVEKTEIRLKGYQDMFEDWVKCQRDWIYLEPIFGSEEIKVELPEPSKWFEDVDSKWRQIMNYVKSNNLIFESPDQEKIPTILKRCNELLDKIQKSLNKYLSAKREEFPRFYFLSDEELLEILSKAKDPTLVTKYMKKCFEAIEYIEFNKMLEVINMKSSEKECVTFLKPVVTSQGHNKGRVEKWLNDVEVQMRDTLYRSSINCASDVTERTKWVFKWPGQIILAVNNTRWTAGVEDAIENGSLKEYYDRLISEREDIVDLVKGELSPLQRMTLGALIVIDQHAIYVVEMLVNNQINSKGDFEWISQLRYYMRQTDKEKLMVEMITSCLPYQYEYLGNSDRLVITPLTDRCYRTLMGAFQYYYGGAPEGPAGTGKTETVKDLAKAIAVQCVVFNCSDQLNYVAMSKFFRGLSQCGAWCCFDEFNRIQPEVLSVIAEQVRQIQQGIRSGKPKFFFEGTEIRIKPSAFTCITMNPGYAGRAELPDNLKALFRPCAMMVPEYSLISEIVLFSYGYQTATSLAKKIVSSLRLSSEQLSTQKHYDFGMRALKAILVAAGNLKKKYLKDKSAGKDENVERQMESRLCIRALFDVNLPKFTENDIPLFESITSDLFGPIQPPETDYSLLIETIKIKCDSRKVMPEPVILKKCIELYETLLVRHGLMLVGQTNSAKTTVLGLLKDSLTELTGKDDYVHVKDYWLNPKAVDSFQLFGKLDTNTKLWTDGILPHIMRICENDNENPERKWVVFDGPVDAVWIENMNTVLDDNKILCLTNGQKIKVTPQMNMMFEVEDLNEASPATVSRCGMVYLEPKQLGWKPLIVAYTQYRLPKCMQHLSGFMEMTLIWMLTPVLAYVRKKSKFPFLVDNLQMAISVIRIINSLCAQFHQVDLDEAEGRDPNKEIKEMIKDHKQGESLINNYSLFSVVWGVGGVIEDSRHEFNKFLMKLVMFEKVQETYNLDLDDPDWEPRGLNYNLGDATSLYEILFDIRTNQWTSWMKTVAKWVPPSPTTPFNELIVPTSDTIRNSYLINLMIMNNYHILLTGPTGTAKTISAVNEILTNYKSSDIGNLMMVFSGQTSCNQVQLMIEEKMTKVRRGVYRPVEQKSKLVVFIDDVNMPVKEEYGAQPPIELLRMWADHGFWYDLLERDKKVLENMQLLCTMGPPSTGRNMVSRRFLRHFFILFTEPFDDKSLKTIFSSIMDWYFLGMKGKLPSSIIGLKDQVIEGTINVYTKVSARLLPTPKKSHYIYNLRDASRVIQGITKATAHSFSDPNDMIKLWAHECMRVFSDRLINKEDQQMFIEDILKPVMSENFKKPWQSVVKLEPVLFGSFIPTRHPDGDQTKPAYPNLYCELVNRENLQKYSERYLLKYNEQGSSGDDAKDKLSLVLFMTALEHLVRIVRILETPFGHALLVGVGGSGKKSLAKLATFIMDYDRFSIELTKSYDYKKDWPESLQTLMIRCGVDNKPNTFLFIDTQIFTEAVLEDISSILNQGEVPNLFNAEQKGKVQNDLAEQLGDEAEKYTPAQINELFSKNCKKNLHLVLSFSPVGELFRKRLRTFPSLINCTTIDWFLPWPNEALKSVALALLQDSEVAKDEIEKVADIFVIMQDKIVELARRYLEELRKYFYVTPTSYIELVNCFKKMLTNRMKESKANVNKYTVGLEKINNADIEVFNKKKELEELTPMLQEQTIVTEKLLETVQREQEEADKQKAICERDEIECNIIKEEATKMKQECQIDVDEAETILERCRKELDNILRKDIDELKGMKNPNEAVRLLFQALCIIMKSEVKLIKDPNDPFKKIPDYLTPVRNEIMKDANKMVLNLKSYDDVKVSREIDQGMIDKIKHMMATEKEFTQPRLTTTSQAAGALFGWFTSIIEVYDKLLIVNPKRENLKIAQARLEGAEATLSQKKAELQKITEKIDSLKRQQKEAEDKKADLKDKVTICKRQLHAAEELTSGFKSEKVTWAERAKVLNENIPFILGECLVASGVIAFLGAFPMDYRNKATEYWMKIIKEKHIKLPDEFSLRSVCIDDLTVTEWIDKYKLPNDSISIENAIIMKESSRYPLIIDPQLQATKWLIELYSNVQDPTFKIKVIKPNSNAKEMPLVISQCITVGTPILVEGLEEYIDPMFESIFDQIKEVEKTTTREIVRLKFMDKFVDLHENFKFFAMTKLSRPHYPPEVCAKVSLINFTVTVEGLQDQLVNIVMSIEQAKLDKDRQTAIKNNARISKSQKETEIKILDLLSNQVGNILDDERLIDTLNTSKKESAEAANELVSIREKKSNYQKKSMGYKDIGFRVSNLFFCVMDMSNVEPMYQFSLEWFIELFKLAIVQSGQQASNPSKDSTRNNDIINTFQEYLFVRVCRSLFERDKLLFSFLIYLKKIVCDGISTNSEIRKLLLNLAPKEAPTKKPIPWLEDRQWNIINELNNVKEFKGILEDFVRLSDKFKAIYDSEQPQLCELPERWNDMNPIQKLILLKVLRGDKITEALQLQISATLGKNFVEFEAFSLESVYRESKSTTPIVFILSPGSDPLTEIEKLSKLKGINADTKPLSLGQGQEKAAAEAINSAKQKGEWVILQNCHLAPGFLSTVEKTLDQVDSDRYRLWLTSMPTKTFPVSLLQNGIKVTTEAPRGLKASMQKTYMTYDNKFLEDMKDGRNITAWKKLVFGLSFFHAIILERRKFGALGWNISYQFSQKDMSISLSQIKTFLENYSDVEWKALHYLIAEANYGGRVTDPMDRRLITVILKTYFTPEVLKDNYKFSESGIYYAPPTGQHDSYLEYIKNVLPLNDEPEVFGMHTNANITSGLNFTNDLLFKVLELQPQISDGGASSTDNIIKQKCKEIFASIPKAFDLEEASKKFPVKYVESMNTVLQQELIRFNNLRNTIVATLATVGEGHRRYYYYEC
jgi:dynein heavy chain